MKHRAADFTITRVPRVTLSLAAAAFVSCHTTAPLARGDSATANYPGKTLRMIVPLAAGGPVDTVARIVGARLAVQLGQQVVIDNRPGAGGSIGGEIVARAAADGYTLLMAANGTIAIAPHLLTKLPYDAIRDFAPVSLIGTSPQALLVHPSLPAHSVGELIALAKARPGKINFASSGQGTTAHLASELLKVAAGIDIVHVPYRGAGPALTDLLAGETQMMITGVSSALPQIRGGKLRVLGVTSKQRIAVLPDVPAIAEALPGYEITTWYALFTTARTDAGVIARLNRETVAAVGQAEIRARLAAAGVEPETGAPQALATMVREESARWGGLVKRLGIGL